MSNHTSSIYVSVSIRPKRIAFIVDNKHLSENELKQIFRYCVSVWGGRYNAIIPTDGQSIESEWWEFLKIVDPDIIYSFKKLDNELVTRIDRYILPISILEISESDAEWIKKGQPIPLQDILEAQRITYNRDLIESISTKFSASKFVFIEGELSLTDDQMFVLCNMGALSPHISQVMSGRSDDTMKTIAASSYEQADLMQMLITYGVPQIPIDVCGAFSAPHYNLKFDQFHDGFHLVVGNGVDDILYAWNRGLISETGWGRNTLWLSEDMVEDSRIIRCLDEWIATTNWEPHPQKKLKLVSYAIPEKGLEQLAKEIKKHISIPVKVSALEKGRFPSPEFESFRRLNRDITTQVPLSNRKGIVDLPQPSFHTDKMSLEGWMADFEIQHKSKKSDWANPDLVWRLPKRQSLVKGFFMGPRDVRVMNIGYPSVAVRSDDPIIELRIPTDEEIAWSIFNRHYESRPRRNPTIFPEFPVITTSDKGKYLSGVIKVFKTVGNAGRILEEPVWREMFLEMAGKPDPEKEFNKRKQIIQDVIESTFRENKDGEKDSGRMEKISETLADKLMFRDYETKPFSEDKVFGRIRQQIKEAEPGADDARRRKLLNIMIDYELMELIRFGALLQGVMIKCNRCGSSLWYHVNMLGSVMQCSGCLSDISPPPGLRWSYKLNDLLLNALRKHGTLAVVESLHHLNLRSHGSFVYVPCKDVIKKGDKKPYTDLDLLVVSKGKFMIGEVKSSPRGFLNEDLSRLEHVAKDLLPDIVILAAPGHHWVETVEKKISRFTKAMETIDVEVQILELMN